MKKLFCFSLLMIFHTSAFHALAQELPVEVNADSVDYDRAKGIVTGVGHVVVTYQDTTLLADQGSVNLKTKEAHAEGHVQIIQKERRLVGDSLDYNFETGRGEFTNATGFYDPWYAKGEKVIRHSKQKYEVQRGHITTCDYPNPHYRLKAQKVDIYPDNKLVARNVVLYVGKLPVFWLPFYVHSLKESPWSFVPGYSKRWGAFFLTSFQWLQTDYVKSRVRLDYRARRGFGVGLDTEYRLKKGGGGKFKNYIISDKRHELPDGRVEKNTRYRSSLSHYSPWKYQTTLRGEFHKLSDQDILKDFFWRDSDYSVQPPSYFDITKYNPKYIARFYVQKRVNSFFTEVERLPEVSLNFTRQRIKKTPLYYTSLSSFSNLSKRFAKGTAAEIPVKEILRDTLSEVPVSDTAVIRQETQDAVRFDTYDEISYPKKYFGWLETNLWLGMRQTWYSRDLTDTGSEWRGSFSDGAELGTKIYRIFDYENPRWDIHGLRHVIEPRVKYTYVLDPTVGPSRLIQFDQIDALTGQNTIRPSIRNKLQTKRNNLSWDLVDFLVYVDYYVTPQSQHDATSVSGVEPFSNIFGDLELRPVHNFSADFDVSYDHRENRVSSFNMDLATFREGWWRLVTGVRFIDHQSTQWTYGIDYILNSDWSVRAYNRWEFENSELQEQEYSIHRNLHCWDGALSFRKAGEEVQVWVTLWLTAYPDLTFDLGN